MYHVTGPTHGATEPPKDGLSEPKLADAYCYEYQMRGKAACAPKTALAAPESQQLHSHK